MNEKSLRKKPTEYISKTAGIETIKAENLFPAENIVHDGRGGDRAGWVRVVLPWPPSNNTVYRHSGGRHYISDKAKAYYARVDNIILAQRNAFGDGERLEVEILAHPPDLRKRDLDNVLKACLDALTKGGLWQDDSQLDALKIERGAREEHGRLVVWVRALKNNR